MFKQPPIHPASVAFSYIQFLPFRGSIPFSYKADNSLIPPFHTSVLATVPIPTKEWHENGRGREGTLCLVHTKLICNTSLHVPTQITERVKTGSFDQMFYIIRYQYVSKQFSVRRSRLNSVRSPLVSSSDRVKSPVHLVGTTFPNGSSPSAVRWNPFRTSCTSFPLRPIPF